MPWPVQSSEGVVARLSERSAAGRGRGGVAAAPARRTELQKPMGFFSSLRFGFPGRPSQPLSSYPVTVTSDDRLGGFGRGESHTLTFPGMASPTPGWPPTRFFHRPRRQNGRWTMQRGAKLFERERVEVAAPSPAKRQSNASMAAALDKK